MAGGGSGSKKMAKVGRNETGCKAYKLSHRREKNKLKKLEKHLRENPNDASCLDAIKRCNLIVKGVAK